MLKETLKINRLKQFCNKAEILKTREIHKSGPQRQSSFRMKIALPLYEDIVKECMH